VTSRPLGPAAYPAEDKPLNRPETLKALAKFCPEALIEAVSGSEVTEALDFAALTQALKGSVNEPFETFQLNFPGKKASYAAAAKPLASFLRPSPAQSLDFATANNLYLKGDTLEALKLLRKVYLEKIKLIFIEALGPFKPLKSSHLAFLSPRLMVARDLLAENGSIFIKTDDHGVQDLTLLTKEIFGERNFIAQLVVKNSPKIVNNNPFCNDHYYVLVLAKNSQVFIAPQKERPLAARWLGQTEEPKTSLRLLRKWGANSLKEDRPNLYYPISDPEGADHYPTLSDGTPGCWRWSQATMNRALKNDLVVFKKKGQVWVAYEKVPEESSLTLKYSTWVDALSFGDRINEGPSLFDALDFAAPMVELMALILKMAGVKETDLVLDFAPETAFLAQAIRDQNEKDGENRRFILAQEPNAALEIPLGRYGLGFKTFKVEPLDSASLSEPGLSEASLSKEGLDPLTRLTTALLALGVDLGLPIKLECLGPKEDKFMVYTVGLDYLIFVFTEIRSNEPLWRLARVKCQRVIFLDAVFTSDDLKINAIRIFQLLAPEVSLSFL
jgi:adenine-specific DNA-methyltransferase